MEHLEPPHARSNKNTDAGLVELLMGFRVSLLLDSSIPECLLGRHHGVGQAIVVPPGVLLVDQSLVIKVLDLSCERRGELRRVETGDGVDSRDSVQELVVVMVVVVAEHGGDSHSGDHHALLRVGDLRADSHGGPPCDVEATAVGSESRERCRDAMQRRGPGDGGDHHAHTTARPRRRLLPHQRAALRLARG